eukprot:4641619-Pyramimonas_sp.AAC.2
MEVCAAASGVRRHQKAGPKLPAEQHREYNPDKIARVLARSEAKQSASGQAILSCEATREPFSDSEPEGPF